MPDPLYATAVLVIAATITFILRAAPFAVVDRLRSAPAVADLARRLPAGVMVILVVYLLKDVSFTAPTFDAVHLSGVLL